MKSLALILMLILLPQAPSMAQKPVDSVPKKACLITAQSDRLFNLKDGGNRKSADRKWAKAVNRCVSSINPSQSIAARYVPPGRRGAQIGTQGGGTRAVSSEVVS
jgi:hypothetical protein